MAPWKITSKEFHTAQPRAGGSNLSTTTFEAVENHPGPDLKTRMWCYKQNENYFQLEAPGTSQAQVGQEGQVSQGRK